MQTKWTRMPRLELEVGCLAPLALAIAVAVAVGVMVGMAMRPGAADLPPAVNVRVIDDGAKGGPKILATAVVPLR